MRARLAVSVVCASLASTAVSTSAQIAFPKVAAYAALGDSVAAGTGAMPVTHGYSYQLYDRGVFGPKQDVAFAAAAVRGARSWELRDHQVPQLLCSVGVVRPTIVTITAGANDLFQGDLNVFGIAGRVAEAVNALLNNPFTPAPVLDPATGLPCPPLQNVTVLVSNYYSIPHPDPAVFALLDGALHTFDLALRTSLAVVPVPSGSRVAIVDLYTPSLGRQGLVTIERRLGFSGPFDFDPHPTNAGHTFIAREFERVWDALQ